MTDFIDQGEDFLAHYGVKGMKWGQRKQRAVAGASKAVGRVARKKVDSSGNTVISVGRDRAPQPVKARSIKINAKTEVRTSKGGHFEAHPDAVRAKAAKQQRKKSGIDTLSNKELEHLANRMNLEQRIKDLEKKRPATDLENGEKYITTRVMKGAGAGFKAYRGRRAKPKVQQVRKLLTA